MNFVWMPECAPVCVRSRLGALAFGPVVVGGATSCKQDVGERCEQPSDCSSGVCSGTLSPGEHVSRTGSGYWRGDWFRRGGRTGAPRARAGRSWWTRAGAVEVGRRKVVGEAAWKRGVVRQARRWCWRAQAGRVETTGGLRGGLAGGGVEPWDGGGGGAGGGCSPNSRPRRASVHETTRGRPVYGDVLTSDSFRRFVPPGGIMMRVQSALRFSYDGDCNWWLRLGVGSAGRRYRLSMASTDPS